uniref:Uncharacterized protein n=1 Tax=Populus trichocarpa TaxID=3694 RepID=A0A3N7EYX9_POPTR
MQYVIFLHVVFTLQLCLCPCNMLLKCDLVLATESSSYPLYTV